MQLGGYSAAASGMVLEGCMDLILQLMVWRQTIRMLECTCMFLTGPSLMSQTAQMMCHVYHVIEALKSLNQWHKVHLEHF